MPSTAEGAPTHDDVEDDGRNRYHAIGDTLLASQVIALGAVALPSLTGYRTLFGISGGAAPVGAAIALVVPRAPAG